MFNNATLQEMASSPPLTVDEMKDIDGVSAYKLAQYGQQFLEVTMKYAVMIASRSCQFVGICLNVLTFYHVNFSHNNIYFVFRGRILWHVNQTLIPSSHNLCVKQF